MNYIILLFVTMLFNLHILYAQEKAEIDATLNKVISASISSNVQELLDGTSPRLLKVMGGKEQALKLFN